MIFIAEFTKDAYIKRPTKLSKTQVIQMAQHLQAGLSDHYPNDLEIKFFIEIQASDKTVNFTSISELQDMLFMLDDFSNVQFRMLFLLYQKGKLMPIISASLSTMITCQKFHISFTSTNSIDVDRFFDQIVPTLMYNKSDTAAETIHHVQIHKTAEERKNEQLEKKKEKRNSWVKSIVLTALSAVAAGACSVAVYFITNAL